MRERLKKEWKTIAATLAALLVYRRLMLFLYGSTCPSVILTGLPCPGCGMTRAVKILLRGDLAASWAMNPMAVPVLLLVAYCLVWHFAKGTRIPGFGALATVLAAVGIVVFCWRMAQLFPLRQPYVYTGGSVLAHLVPGYREHVLHLWEALLRLG